MARTTSAVVALTWREQGGCWLLEQGGREHGRAWPQGALWLARVGGNDASGGGCRYPTLDAAREALVAETEARVLDLLSNESAAALRAAGLLS